ncbi:MAG: protease HtpX [Bdellovibrionia bacterium]
MAWIKRISLFLGINLLVMFTISFLLHVFNVGPYLTHRGIQYSNLMAFCLIWGMGGAFISLALSRFMAKTWMGVHVIDPDTRDPELRVLLEMVYELARSAHLSGMPEVGLYDSPEVNAFATGPSASRSLVAVSTGLLSRLNDDEVRGVLGHEVAHIANGDMVTMTLLQGVVNAFAMFLARAIAFTLAQTMRGDRDDRDRGGVSPMATHFLSMVLEMVFLLLGSIVIAWFSRQREFRADEGGARLAGRDSMIRALQALRRTYEGVDSQSQPSLANLKISSRPSGWMAWFASHPPLEERIARLQGFTA